MIIRSLDILLSLVSLIVLSPIFLIALILILIDSGSPIFYKQKRVGKSARLFNLIKFRTMYLHSDRKGLITVGGRDPRVTKSGVLLRKLKLDEFPQLFNVLLGDMSIVGPRPEVQKYVNLYPKDYEYLLSVRPGITSPASLKYSNENEILERQNDPEYHYRTVILPAKIELDKKCIENRHVFFYFKIILLTIRKVFTGNRE